MSFLKLLLLPQRYKFSSKSQQVIALIKNCVCCCCYHKGTNFQANHNVPLHGDSPTVVVVATTKVQIFKQITTDMACPSLKAVLLLLPQRYKFSSKSQLVRINANFYFCCCCYHKGTNFQANHNIRSIDKVSNLLLLLPQRYKFSSKSQLIPA